MKDVHRLPLLAEELLEMFEWALVQPSLMQCSVID